MVISRVGRDAVGHPVQYMMGLDEFYKIQAAFDKLCNRDG